MPDKESPDANRPLPLANRPSPRAKRGKRGGRRPGAGAPRGNLNALKHGRRSRQFAELGAIIASDPGATAMLLALAGRRQRHHRRAQETASALIAGIYVHARQVAQGNPSYGPFAGLARLKHLAKAPNAALSEKGRENLMELLDDIVEDVRNSSPDNQTLRQQSDGEYENAPD